MGAKQLADEVLSNPKSAVYKDPMRRIGVTERKAHITPARGKVGKFADDSIEVTMNVYGIKYFVKSFYYFHSDSPKGFVVVPMNTTFSVDVVDFRLRF